MLSVSVLIVTWNSEQTIARCLRSVPPGVEVVVVDNASSDRTVECIRADFPWVRLIESSKNLGFGAGCNLAATKATGTALLLLNPDGALAPGCLEQLLLRLESEEELGAIAPRIESEEGDLELSWGESIGLFAEWCRKAELAGRRPVPGIPSGPLAWISGACILIRRVAWDGVQGFDEGFFLYFEDLDLCMRLQDAAWTIRIEPKALVRHTRGHSACTIPKQVRRWYRESQLRFYRKHTSLIERLLLRCYLFSISLLRNDLVIAKLALRSCLSAKVPPCSD